MKNNDINNTRSINNNNNNNNDNADDDDDNSYNNDICETSSTDESERYWHPSDHLRIPFQQSQLTQAHTLSKNNENVQVR